MYCVRQEIGNATEELSNKLCPHNGGLSQKRGCSTPRSCQTTIPGRAILLLEEHQGHKHSDWYKWHSKHHLSCDVQVELRS